MTILHIIVVVWIVALPSMFALSLPWGAPDDEPDEEGRENAARRRKKP